MADHDAGEGTEEEWRFPLSEFEEDGDADGTAGAGGDRAEADADDAEEAAEPERIKAGDPSLEGAAFVLLGVAFALFVISRLFLG